MCQIWRRQRPSGVTGVSSHRLRGDRRDFSHTMRCAARACTARAGRHRLTIYVTFTESCRRAGHAVGTTIRGRCPRGMGAVAALSATVCRPHSRDDPLWKRARRLSGIPTMVVTRQQSEHLSRNQAQLYQAGADRCPLCPKRSSSSRARRAKTASQPSF